MKKNIILDKERLNKEEWEIQDNFNRASAAGS